MDKTSPNETKESHIPRVTILGKLYYEVERPKQLEFCIVLNKDYHVRNIAIPSQAFYIFQPDRTAVN
jgi:hypothetical protein